MSSASTWRCARAPVTTRNLKSFVNIIATPEGRHHVAGFEQAVAKTMNEVLRAKKLLRVAEDDIVQDDALEGLTAVVTVRLAEPQFEGRPAGPRHLGGPQDRDERVLQRTQGLPDHHEAGRGRAGPGS